MIMKKYRRSEVLCGFVARYIFGQFFPCCLRPMNNQGLETDGNTKSTEKKIILHILQQIYEIDLVGVSFYWPHCPAPLPSPLE